MVTSDISVSASLIDLPVCQFVLYVMPRLPHVANVAVMRDDEATKLRRRMYDVAAHFAGDGRVSWLADGGIFIECWQATFEGSILPVLREASTVHSICYEAYSMTLIDFGTTKRETS